MTGPDDFGRIYLSAGSGEPPDDDKEREESRKRDTEPAPPPDDEHDEPPPPASTPHTIIIPKGEAQQAMSRALDRLLGAVLEAERVAMALARAVDGQ